VAGRRIPTADETLTGRWKLLAEWRNLKTVSGSGIDRQAVLTDRLEWKVKIRIVSRNEKLPVRFQKKDR